MLFEGRTNSCSVADINHLCQKNMDTFYVWLLFNSIFACCISIEQICCAVGIVFITIKTENETLIVIAILKSSLES